MAQFDMPKTMGGMDKGLVFAVLALVLVTLRGALENPWILTALPGTLAFIYGLEQLGRRTAVRARTPAKGKDPAWLGRLHPFSDFVWPDLPWWSHRADGIRAVLYVQPDGITIARRRVLSRQPRDPTFFPWTDIVGARSRDRGRRMPSGSTFHVLRQTEITIDLTLTARQREALHEPREPAGGYPIPTQPPIPQVTLATVELPSMRVGTAPLAFITPVADGLLDAVAAKARGCPPDAAVA